MPLAAAIAAYSIIRMIPFKTDINNILYYTDTDLLILQKRTKRLTSIILWEVL